MVVMVMVFVMVAGRIVGPVARKGGAGSAEGAEGDDRSRCDCSLEHLIPPVGRVAF
jgi:hypothetical protein